jgi:chromate transport protein ChrA
MVWIYCAILLWSLPITIPVGISHVAYAAFLYGRGYLNWFSAAIGGFAHGIAAVLLMAVFYSHDKGWPQFGALISFGLAGTVIALILHAVIPLYRRSGRRATAP